METLKEVLPYPRHMHEGALPQDTYAWYRDASSFLYEVACKAGYTVISDALVAEAQALPAQTTNQQTEIIVLTHTFQLAEG